MKSTLFSSLFALLFLVSTPLNGQMSFDHEDPDEPEEAIVYNDQLIKLKMVINPMWEFESAAVKISMSKNEKFVRSAAPDNNGKYDLFLRYGEVYDFVVSQAGCMDKKFRVDTRYKGYYDSMVRQIFEIHLREPKKEDDISEDYAFKLFKNQRGKLQLFFED